jgi:hypothetical protein
MKEGGAPPKYRSKELDGIDVSQRQTATPKNIFIIFPNRRIVMTTRDLDLFCEKRIRPDIRRMIEVHILENLPLKAACEKAGLPYQRHVSQHKFSKAGKAYIAILKQRRRVILEFGIDETSLVALLKIRDESLVAGSYVAAVRAHELCLQTAEKAKMDRREMSGKKNVNDMTREEMLAELSALKLKAGGKPFEKTKDPRDAAFWESVRSN